jgi:outer membrane protein assembly factor BamB
MMTHAMPAVVMALLLSGSMSAAPQRQIPASELFAMDAAPDGRGLVSAGASAAGSAGTRSVEGVSLRVSLDAMALAAAGSSPLRIAAFPLSRGMNADLEIEPFSVTSARTKFIRGGTALAFNPSSVSLFHGRVAGYDHSSVFLAFSPWGCTGAIDLGDGGARYRLMPGERGGEISREQRIRIVRAEGSGDGPSPEFEPCRMLGRRAGFGAASSLERGKVPQGPEPWRGARRVQIAVDTDFEFFELFDDADAAAAYIVQLYGEIAAIYLRDVDLRPHLSFVRIWDAEENLYNAADPLGPFRTHWEDTMGAVDRDVAQLLTGRRNLPYGGVAYLNALCEDVGYSVCGYLLGSFPATTLPSFARWDVIVTAHELGHNCGTVHTHDLGIDECATGTVQRGTIMSYCHTVPGGNANIDLYLHAGNQAEVDAFVPTALCLAFDCNGNGVDDADDIGAGPSLDVNLDGVPDECQDCNGNGVLDPIEIGFGAADVNLNGRLDVCETDCNANGTPDEHEIDLGAAVDAYGNRIPDACETDCNSNGTSDYTEIELNIALDVDRNSLLDACQDCDADGVSDLVELDGANNLWIASTAVTTLRQFHIASGIQTRQSTGSAVASGQDLAIDALGRVYVTSPNDNRVARFSRTGAFLGNFISGGGGGLSTPSGLTFGPDGNLYVANRGSNSVTRHHGSTGALVGTFIAAGAGGLVQPHGIAFGPNGNLFVTSNDHRVLQFSGSTGALVSTFVAAGSGGLDTPRGLLFKPDGNLLVASQLTHAILEYDGDTGAYVRRFDRGATTTTWRLRDPWSMRIGPDGHVFVTSNTAVSAVQSYHGESGHFLRSFYVFSSGGAQGATGLAFVPAAGYDCNLNLRPDSCDIALGDSSDINGNGVPDECEGPICLADCSGPGDGMVDVSDLLALLAQWGGVGACDIDGSGAVDVADLLALLAAWGDCS